MRGGDWNRIPAWLCIWLLLGLIALLCESGAALAGFAVMTLLPIAGMVLCLLARNKLQLRMRFPVLGNCDTLLEGELEATNLSLWPIGQLICRIELDNRLTGQTESVTVRIHPAAKSSAVVPLRFASRHCGYVKIRTKRVYVTDLTGVVMIPVPVMTEAKLTALPELMTANVHMDYPAITPDDGENWLDGRKGTDYTQILQLREYVPGDSIRQIHWKLSSKLDRTIVKDPSFPVSRSLLILWDKTVAPAEPAQMHAIAETLFAVCRAMTEQGFAYTLAWNDGINMHDEQIMTEDELLQAMPRMLKSGSRDAERSALIYVNQTNQERYSKILYFAAACPTEALLDAFAQDSDLTLLICGEATASATYRTICYTPETCGQMLQNLELEA